MAYSGDNDELTIIESIRQGDKPAMKRLYDRYAGYLAGVCSRYIACDDDIWDILQDSFIIIYTSLSGFEYRGAGSLQAWMSRIVINECLKFLKDRVRFSRIDGEVDIPDNYDDDDMDVADIPQSVILDELRALPAGYRTVFNLYVFENKSHKEIASILDIKENTSASQLHKAKKMLAGRLMRYKSEVYE